MEFEWMHAYRMAEKERLQERHRGDKPVVTDPVAQHNINALEATKDGVVDASEKVKSAARTTGEKLADAKEIILGE